MPLIRQFQGQIIRRTRRLGDQIVIRFRSDLPGRPGQRLVVPLAQYLTGRKATYHPPASARR